MQYFVAVLGAVAYSALSLHCLHCLQLISYKPTRGYHQVLFGRYFRLLLLMQVIMFVLALLQWEYMYFVNVIIVGVAYVIAPKFSVKLPLKYTARIIRLLVVLTAIYIAMLIWLPLFLLPIFVPIVVLIALAVTYPLELTISQYYLKKAIRKLAHYSGTIIAVTGSYGKTSVKNILSHLLEHSICTPSSYNTPQGVARFVNGCDLDRYKYVVLEFGARQRGDIAYLARLYRPSVAVITGIADCHLSTMKTRDNIVATKQELVQYLSADGICILNGNDSELSTWNNIGRATKILSTKVVHCVIHRVALQGTDADITVNGAVYSVNIPLLGLANVDNCMLSLATVIALGENLPVAIHKLSNLQQIPHRMQLIRGTVDIIDDSYNCNIEGVRMCCNTIKQLDIDVKIVIAQGIVECGEDCKNINVAVGGLLATAFDVVIVTGSNSEYLLEGCHGHSCAHSACSLTEAVALASKYYTNNCVVVITNDIP